MGNRRKPTNILLLKRRVKRKCTWAWGKGAYTISGSARKRGAGHRRIGKSLATVSHCRTNQREPWFRGNRVCEVLLYGSVAPAIVLPTKCGVDEAFLQRSAGISPPELRSPPEISIAPRRRKWLLRLHKTLQTQADVISVPCAQQWAAFRMACFSLAASYLLVLLSGRSRME